MASYVTPKKNTAFVFFVALTSQANPLVLQANPTLAAGDVKVSIDGGAFANLTTLPTVTPAAGTSIQVSLSAGEMNGDNILIAFIDAAGAEWCDLAVGIQTTNQQINDLASPTFQLIDAVPADGTLPTIQQALYMIVQFLTERSTSGLTMTVKKPDGASALMTFTLNDAVAPTSITRAT